MAYWIDNADSWICSACGHEVNNPNKLPNGPGVCPNCKSTMGVREAGSNMTIERAKQIAKQWANGYVCSLREGEAEEYHKMCLSALQEQQEQESNARMTVAKLRKFASAKPPVCGGNCEYTSPCDLCAYNPPSSFDGKLCAMCPATPPTKEGEEE